MRAYEFITESRRGGGNSTSTMFHGIDPLANPMPGLFGKPRKAKKTPDSDEAAYKRYPKKMYATSKMITPAQRDALEADDEFKKLRQIYQDAAQNLANNPKTNEPGHVVGLFTIANNAIDKMAKRREEVLQQAGLPSMYG